MTTISKIDDEEQIVAGRDTNCILEEIPDLNIGNTGIKSA